MMIGQNLTSNGETAQCVTDGSCGREQGPRTVRVSVEVRASQCFFEALAEAVVNGSRITRAGWNAAGQWVAVQHPDKGSKMSQPYLYLKNAQNELVPWAPSQGDIFARDWAVLPR